MGKPPLKTELPDGLYQVQYKGICAGFVVESGIVISYAPILYMKFRFWESIAKRIGP